MPGGDALGVCTVAFAVAGTGVADERDILVCAGRAVLSLCAQSDPTSASQIKTPSREGASHITGQQKDPDSLSHRLRNQ